MSPHIIIDVALDGLADIDCPPLNEVLVERIIVRLLTDDAITTEEFHHYCKRLTDTIARRPRRAA